MILSTHFCLQTTFIQFSYKIGITWNMTWMQCSAIQCQHMDRMLPALTTQRTFQPQMFTSIPAFVFMALYSTEVTLSNSLTAYPSAPYSFLVFSLICALVAYQKWGLQSAELSFESNYLSISLDGPFSQKIKENPPMIYKAFNDTTATTIFIEMVYTTHMIYNVCKKEICKNVLCLLH